MKYNTKFSILHFFERLSIKGTKAAGSNHSIVIAFLIVFCWLAAGPHFGYSDHWLWMISIITTIITFLMVFVIQKSQNKDSLATQLKLNELIAAHEFASNRLVDIENKSEVELKIIQKYYSKLSNFIKNDNNLQQSHSIDELEVNHDIKMEMEQELLEKIIKKAEKS